VETGSHAGKKVVALLTDMSAPLGIAVGNANETREALEILHGRGPDDLRECTMVLAEEMLLLAGKASARAPARELLENAIADGSARRVMERMIEAQGGDPKVVAEPDRLKVAPSTPVVAELDGVVTDVDPLEIGLAAVGLGAGRSRADQAVDPGVGVMVHAKPGTRVTRGALLAEVQAWDAAAAVPIVERVRAAFRVGREAGPKVPLVHGRVEPTRATSATTSKDG
jgi:thymidine phosphorylase